MIRTARSARVLTITLHRPDHLNALNSEVLTLVRTAIDDAQRDASVGCIVIKGAGQRAFSAGADLDEIRGLAVEAAQEFINAGHRTMSTIATSEVPVLASVDGYALGGGFELALACHLVLASHRSQFGLPEARIGCMPGFGGTQRLPRAIGGPAAMHLLLTGERIRASRAWEIGLLSVPPLEPDALDDEVTRLAELIASGSRRGVANILSAVGRALAPAALEHEAALAALSIASRDGQEGISSFVERREPRFHEEST